MCVSEEEADRLLDLARGNGVCLGVGHNMLYATPYTRLREAVHSGALGPLDYVAVNHFVELPHIRFGPFDTWMLSNPGNVVLEIGPHLFSAMLDLVGSPDQLSATADRKIRLPGGLHLPRRWRVQATVGRTMVHVNMDFGPGFPRRTIEVRGLSGSASLDFDANTCTIDQPTTLSLDLDRYKRSRSTIHQVARQARATLADYALSKFKFPNRGSPYQTTFAGSIASFYSGLRAGKTLDARIDGRAGREVVSLCTRVIREAEVGATATAVVRTAPTIRPSVLIIGGSGFIGRALVQRLTAAGYGVRVMARTSGAMLTDLPGENVEIFRGDARKQTDLKRALDGISFVYHLATAQAKTWDDRLRNEVEPTRVIADSCLAAGIRRLVFTGTIDSYYAGGKAGTIDEATPLDPRIGRRNYYARAKASAEAILMDMHRTRKLPVVIVRPGIVIGAGGNPFHFGVGLWSSPSVCEVWGDGQNKLPFVLVSDVAAALFSAIQVPGIEGRSYNLVDVPLLTARDYIDQVQKKTGMRLTVYYRPIWRFYLSDLAKWPVKLCVRHPDRVRIPSYWDWESRTQKAYFDCRRARTELSWTPASDLQRMIDEGIGGSLHSWLEACE
jgi:nucleoside-diphosphate-sugar epimerase/predicted dehydrogenase